MYHADYENIKQAVAKVKGVAEYVEEKKKIAENIQEVLRVQDKIVGKSIEVEVTETN